VAKDAAAMPNTKTGPVGAKTGQVEELQLLLEISQVLDSCADLREAIEPVLALITERKGMERGTVTIVNPGTQAVEIEAAYGLSKSQQERGHYKRGEGITGRVLETGKSIVVPRVSEEPLFLNRTGARKGLRQELSFLCVPIRIGREVVGTLSFDCPFRADRRLEDDLRIVTIVAAMLAQAARLRQSMREEQRRLMEENKRLQGELRERFRPTNLIGISAEMDTVLDLVENVSKSNATVLIRGESGTGKELVAHTIHLNSLRAGQPYVKVNCAALPEGVIESELFGHERGAFTGAVALHKGRFELATGGTIFLDEIGYVSLTTQVKLLRVLQEREFERVGGTRTIPCDVRVVAATNRNLEELMASGTFLKDLYYRLNVFPIHLPPLRERRSDIMQLADHFVEKYGKQHGKAVRRISTSAIDMMMAYHWPGNVRELENCIERAVLLSNDGAIHGHHLPPTLQTAEASGTAHSGTLQETMDRVERDILIDALKSARGNSAKAARALGLTERIMGLRVAKYGIEPKRFRMGA
jgi:Nif-specific regulatory protein